MNRGESETRQQAAPEERAGALLAVVRDLAAELHPHQAGTLQVTLNSALDQELGFDSLSRIELLARIEQTFGVGLPEQALASAETPLDLLRALETAVPGARHAPESAPLAHTLGDAEAAPARAATLADVLDWHVEAHPDRPHIYYYGDDERVHELTYADLLRGSEAVACGLVERGFAPGQTVAIMLPTCLEYFFSFMGTLLAGGVPVPIYPPARPSQIEDHLRRHAGILNNAQTSVLITFPEAKVPSRLLRMQVEGLEHVVTPQELHTPGHELARPPLHSGQLAHLQYTSGSTGSPKGVMLTHANLLANIRALGRQLEADSTDVLVSWLPLYHDMGLIGAWLGTLYHATPLVLMSPLAFLAHPEFWLWSIHRHRGTISGGPNFAYELCLRRISDEQLEGLDLSSWRVAFNGAEPVIPETMRRFAERFAPYGLRSEAMAPMYGLAESSVGLTLPPPERGLFIDRVQREPFMRHGRAEPAAPDDEAALEFVACGQPLPGHEVRIVNDAGHELGEREEGRLEFQGPSSTSGYYRNPEETRRLFHGDWLDSGDQAYVAGGDIYLTGRRKDIIIRAGRNIYPHELEETIGNLPGVRKGCVAVFGSTDSRSGTERLVAVAETRENEPDARRTLEREIEARAVDLLGNPLDEVVLVPPHTVPKTSSGKIRRASARELYEKGLAGTRPRAVWLQVARLWLAGLTPQWRRRRRLVRDWVYGLYWLFWLVVLAVPLWLLVAAIPRPRWAWAVVRTVARLLFRLTGTRLQVRGLEHLPRGEPSVLVVNHGSYLDSLVLAASLPGAWSFVAKRELLGSFVTRIFLKRMGTQFVERFDKQRGVDDARRVARTARGGLPLIVFPEGTFRRSPGLMPFHMGAFQAAADADIPVVPAVIRGTRSMLRSGQWLPRRSALSVTIAPPIAPEGSGWAAAIRLRDRTRAEMLRFVGEPDLSLHSMAG